jgi:hypothetical protein
MKMSHQMQRTSQSRKLHLQQQQERQGRQGRRQGLQRVRVLVLLLARADDVLDDVPWHQTEDCRG